MIITFTQKDYDIVESAIKDQQTANFGVLYCFLSGHVYPKAGNSEDVYLTAHGNDSEIGDASGFGLTASKVADILYDTFLGGYWNAAIYLSTCDSYPTFAKTVLSRLQVRDSSRVWKVFGAEGGINYQILLKGDVSWQKA
jgi:hypothetical protein